MNLLVKREVLRFIVQPPNSIKMVGCKWIFAEKMRKIKHKGIKACLVAQGFSQRLGVDYEET